MTLVFRPSQLGWAMPSTRVSPSFSLHIAGTIFWYFEANPKVVQESNQEPLDPHARLLMLFRAKRIVSILATGGGEGSGGQRSSGCFDPTTPLRTVLKRVCGGGGSEIEFEGSTRMITLHSLCRLCLKSSVFSGLCCVVVLCGQLGCDGMQKRSLVLMIKRHGTHLWKCA